VEAATLVDGGWAEAIMVVMDRLKCFLFSVPNNINFYYP